MAHYTAHMMGQPSNPAHEHDTLEAAEANEAADTSDFWASWVADVRDSIEQSGGDSEDGDILLATLMERIADAIEISVNEAEKRANEFARNTLRLAEDATHKIGRVQREARETRERQQVEAEVLVRRLDGMAAAIESVTRENAALTARLAAQESESARAVGALEKEIAKERALRRLLDAQRNRPHTQQVASELAKRHAMKALENMKGKTETEAA
jgi:Zn-dependent peptidase ImmA (M78 family)